MPQVLNTQSVQVVFSRVWAMPSADTFSIPAIGGFVKKYLMKSKVSVDPFARNKRWATYTNDLNPCTAAEMHVTALEFLQSIPIRSADLALFDPPYSLGQAMECYSGIGREFLQNDAQQVGRWTKEKDIIAELISVGGHVLTFGWNTIGMGVSRGFEIKEIMLVAHGSAHNDTICVAERKIEKPSELWDDLSPGSSQTATDTSREQKQSSVGAVSGGKE